MTSVVNLKRFRNKYKLTQEKAAKSIGIDQRQWNRYENGRNDIPVRYLKSICINNTVSADWLLEIHDKEALDIKKELERFRDMIFFDILDYAIGNNYIDQITADEILKPMIDSTLEKCIKEIMQKDSMDKQGGE